MRIGVNSRIYQNENTGIPYYIECLYKYCLKTDKKNDYVFFQTDINKKLGKTSIINLSNTSLSAFLFDNFLVNKLIKKEKIDIYHGPASILPFFKKKGVKYIVTIHDLSFLVYPHNQSYLFNLYYKNAVGKALRNADIILADSKNTKKDIIKFYHTDSSKILVVYPGVNDLFFSKKTVKRIIKNKYFFTLTTHPKRKNIYRILDLIAENKNINNLKFVIAGLIPKDQLHDLKSLIKRKGIEKNVHIYGYATENELKSLYQNAEFFIYPSYYEGFGFPVLEAMISKCPVITSNISSLPEIVPDKKWLADPYNSKEISTKIEKLLSLSDSEKYRLLEKNYNFAKKFSWDKCANNVIKVFISKYDKKN